MLSGLSKRTTTDGLREAFAKFGDVVDGMFLPCHQNICSLIGFRKEYVWTQVFLFDFLQLEWWLTAYLVIPRVLVLLDMQL